MNYRIFVILFCFYTVAVQAQLPSTDIYLFKYQIEGDSIQLFNPQFLTDFNPRSYNNQPSFFSYNDLYLTSYNNLQEQTDIIHLDLKENDLYEVTNTPHSEYSPTLLPDKRYFSCIKVFPEDENAQLLWKYPVDQSNKGKAIFPDIKNVGYHIWLSPEKVAMFLVDSPHKLVIGDVQTKDTKVVLENIGRSFKMSNNGNLLFIHKINETLFYIKEYNFGSNRAKIITPTLEGLEDFDILDDGSLVMGKGSELYRLIPGIDSAWKKVISLDKFGITNIGRISSIKDRIAIVSKN